jgi:hypothetical protein
MTVNRVLPRAAFVISIIAVTSFSQLSLSASMQVVYSKKPIRSKTLKANDPALTTQFELGDTVYARIYTKDGRSIGSHQSSPGNPLRLSIKIDGRRINYYAIHLSAAELKRSYADVHLIPKPGTPLQVVKTQTKKNAVLAEVIARKFGASSSTVAIDMGNWGKFPFTMTYSAAGKAKLDKMVQSLESASLGSVQLPKPKMRNKALQRKMLALARKSSKIFGGKPIRVIITSGWSIERHKRTGKPVEKNIFTALIQQEDAKKCFFQNVRFTRPYLGRRYRALQVGGVGMGTKVKILCKSARR